MKKFVEKYRVWIFIFLLVLPLALYVIGYLIGLIKVSVIYTFGDLVSFYSGYLPALITVVLGYMVYLQTNRIDRESSKQADKLEVIRLEQSDKIEQIRMNHAEQLAKQNKESMETLALAYNKSAMIYEQMLDLQLSEHLPKIAIDTERFEIMPLTKNEHGYSCVGESGININLNTISINLIESYNPNNVLVICMKLLLINTSDSIIDLMKINSRTVLERCFLRTHISKFEAIQPKEEKYVLLLLNIDLDGKQYKSTFVENKGLGLILDFHMYSQEKKLTNAMSTHLKFDFDFGESPTNVTPNCRISNGIGKGYFDIMVGTPMNTKPLVYILGEEDLKKEHAIEVDEYLKKQI